MRFHKEPAEDFACSESSFFQAYKKTVTEDIVAQRSSTAQLRKLCRGFVQPSWLPWIASDPMSLRILPQQRFQVWWSRCPPSILIRLDMWLYTIYCRRNGLCRREEIAVALSGLWPGTWTLTCSTWLSTLLRHCSWPTCLLSAACFSSTRERLGCGLWRVSCYF